MTTIDPCIGGRLAGAPAPAGPGPEAAAAAHPRRRDPVPPALYAAYGAAVLGAAGLFAYAPWRLLSWSHAALVDEGRWFVGPAGMLLAAVGFFAGARWCAFAAMALLNHRRDLAAPPPRLSHWPKVSILAPAYNEGETIAPAIESLLGLDYPDYEVVVVDDGSRDETLRRAAPYAGDYGHCSVRVFSKPNGGKWSALNYALARSAGELVLCVDADSRLGRGALRHLVARMADGGVSAVAGQVRVRNRVNLLTRLQGLEYVIANGLIRAAQSLSGTVLVVPGPLGLFRRAALEEVFLRNAAGAPHGGAGASDGHGGTAGPGDTDGPGETAGPFEGDTFAEDFDLSLAILSLGGRVVYEPRAVSHTKSPESAGRLLNQRYRWGRGTIQVLRKFFRRAAADPALLHPRLMAWVAVTYLVELLVLPLAGIGGLGFFAAYVLSGGDPAPLLGWGAAFLLLNAASAAFFLAVHEERLWSLAVLPVFDLYHSVLLNSGWAIAVVDELRGARMRW